MSNHPFHGEIPSDVALGVTPGTTGKAMTGDEVRDVFVNKQAVIAQLFKFLGMRALHPQCSWYSLRVQPLAIAECWGL